MAAFSTPANVEPQAAASPLAVQRAIGATTGSSSSTAPQRVIVDVNLNNGLVSDPVKLGNQIRRALEGASVMARHAGVYIIHTTTTQVPLNRIPMASVEFSHERAIHPRYPYGNVHV